MRNLFFQLLFLAVLIAPPAWAAPVQLRFGQHDDYSRLVFDWGSDVSYTKTPLKDGRLTVKFNKKGEVKEVLKPGQMHNIQGVTITAADPLTVELSLINVKRIRDFSIGGRVIIDVYGDGTPPPKTEKPPRNKAVEPPPEKQIQEEKTAAQPPEKEREKTPPSATSHPASSEQKEKLAKDLQKIGLTQDDVEVATAPPPVSATAPPPKKKHIKPNLISISSTNAAAMGVFKLYDDLWIINGVKDQLLSPQVTGPNAAEIGELVDVPLENARAFKVKALDGAKYKAQGGGLIWRIIISSDIDRGDPVEPVRQGAVEGQIGGASILWPLEEVDNVIDFVDPVSGVTLKVVTVGKSDQFFDKTLEFLEFETVPAPAGLVISPKVDDLEVTKTDRGVLITRPGGLVISSEQDIAFAKTYLLEQAKKKKQASAKPRHRIYHFENWQLGPLESLAENHNVLISTLPEMKEMQQVESLLNMARMYLSHGMGPEALGFLRLTPEYLPELEYNLEYRALTGAAEAMSWRSEEAFKTLSAEDLKPHDEANYWRVFALADLGDWQQASDILPHDFQPLHEYPSTIAKILVSFLAEVALRAGDLVRAEELLEIAELHQVTDEGPQRAAISYLRGEQLRQEGKTEEAKKIWKELTQGRDDLYRVKAGLALTRLLLEDKTIETGQAIDALERLRYAWRGDDLEAQVNYWLGSIYFDQAEYVKGLNIMRDAATYAAGTILAPKITAQMKEMFTKMFMSDALQKVPAPEAAALYERYTELIPSGEAGDLIVEKLAEHLVAADLFEKADDLFQYQVNHRLTGEKAYAVTARLAAIRLLDNKPEKAFEALAKAQEILADLPEEQQTEKRRNEISMLSAKAYAQQGRPAKAIEILNALKTEPDVNRLRADIAWRASYWDDAAEALQEVITDQRISLTRPLSEENSSLILQRAVALTLASDRIRLANMREKYAQAMSQTDKARIFEVISRPRQNAALADRDTLMSIVSEVDLFSDFLENYKKAGPPAR